jgi:hypothetical protein
VWHKAWCVGKGLPGCGALGFGGLRTCHRNPQLRHWNPRNPQPKYLTAHKDNVNMPIMTGLVEQLQADAVDPNVPVSTLLRKVKVAAVKLGRSDTLQWVQNELEGYASIDDLPEYRKGSGNTVAWNPYHGWQHIHFPNAGIADAISKVAFFEPIANYEAALAGENDGFKIPLSNEIVSTINESLNVPVPRISNSIPRGLLVRIVERVRDLVLNWALELQRIGITGDGLGFTASERQAAQGAHISIGTFHGSFNGNYILDLA